MIDKGVLAVALACIERHGGSRVALCWIDPPDEAALNAIVQHQSSICALLDVSEDGTRPQTLCGLPVANASQAASTGIVDSVLVIDGANLAWIMRCLEPLARRNALILPCDPDWVVPAFLKERTVLDAKSDPTASLAYVWQSALTGHYAEFGTFWGQSFFPDLFRYRTFLKGRFYAFDSFAGLSAPIQEETGFYPDFCFGNYCSNEKSFRALSEHVGASSELVRVIPGFFSTTLLEKDPAAYGLTPQSLSVCKIDCDLYEPTRQVLDFVLPLLEPGALIYFDDWRLTRASPHVGERGATLDWLKRNRNIELVEFSREPNSWQNQWFIFHRLSASIGTFSAGQEPNGIECGELDGRDSGAAVVPVRADQTLAEFAELVEKLQGQLSTLQTQHEDICNRLDSLTKGVQDWLLPTLAQHSATIERRHRPFRSVRHWGALVGGILGRVMSLVGSSKPGSGD